jgi:DNA-directed RNA polymerase specialized sigma24 family protein
MTITRNLVAEDARRRLPEETRMALLLRSEGKLSYEEISAVLGISAVAARVKVHRARLALTRSIELPQLEKPQ